jgi:hypothetical protein
MGEEGLLQILSSTSIGTVQPDISRRTDLVARSRAAAHRTARTREPDYPRRHMLSEYLSILSHGFWLIALTTAAKFTTPSRD